MSDLKPGDYVTDNQGRVVLTAKYLLNRGYCCESGCRNCPYGFGDQRFQIRPVAAHETFDLRHRILRPHQPPEKCQYEGDEVPGAVHFAALQANDQKQVGIVSAAPERSELFPYPHQFRMRGMAVEPDLRRSRLATRLVAAIEIVMAQRKVIVLWFNAREVAFPFYESLGYSYASPMFEIEGIGPHKVMYKVFETQGI